ncbi:MAG: hypothetical protein AB7O62_24655 [Pirellulales bacterium]
MHSLAADLLAEIELRQDDVLARLDQLNARIEQVLADWTRPDKSAETGTPAIN